MPSKPPLTLIASTPTAVGPPRELGEHGLALWTSIQAEYRIDDVGDITVLVQLCAAADRAEALGARIDADGETITGKMGLKAHPCLIVES